MCCPRPEQVHSSVVHTELIAEIEELVRRLAPTATLFVTTGEDVRSLQPSVRTDLVGLDLSPAGSAS